MNKYYKINEVAQLFHIPVATLHYWEKEGLYSVKRNQENDYRMFELSDVLNIWEIVLYRDLEVPVKQIGNVMQASEDHIYNIYEECEHRVEAQIEILQKKLACIARQKQLVEKTKSLKEAPIHFHNPDFTACSRDMYSMESMQQTLENPYRCCISITKQKEFIRGIVTNTVKKEDSSRIWTRKDNQKYLEFLLRFNVLDATDNNVADIERQAKKMGYEPGEIIGRYLIIAADHGRRYEYYRAWMEVEKM